MKKLTTLVAVATLTAASATSSMAGNLGDTEEEMAPVVDETTVAPAGSLGGGAAPVIAGLAAVALIAVALSDGSSTATTYTPPDE